jgi:hypothetical protein
MSSTIITLTSEQGAVSPSQPTVPVNTGETVSFATGDGSTAYLFFSPDAASILSPAPASPVAVSTAPVTFSFTSSAPGAYSVYLETSATVSLPEFPAVSSTGLALLIDLSNITFGTPNVPTKDGVTPPPTSDS